MEDKKWAQLMRGARFIFRGLVVGVLVIGAWKIGCSSRFVLGSIPYPKSCTVITEETFVEGEDKPNDAGGKSSEAVPKLRKRIIKEESSWVGFAHSGLLLGSQAAVLGMLVWGIVAVMKHED